MKALLINGARPLTTPGAFQVHNPTNSQGWGLINLTNSLPVGLSNSFVQAAAPMQVFDQNPDDALATGQSHTRFVSLSPAATNQPLRITLVWTDPPGNPAASLKLVNNLDLVVTNLVTGEVFFGNDIPAGQQLQPALGHQHPAQPGRGEQCRECLSRPRPRHQLLRHRCCPQRQRQRRHRPDQRRGPGLRAGHLQRRRPGG